MGPGKKSMAIAVRLQPRAATLTEAEIEAVSARVVAGVEKATGGDCEPEACPAACPAVRWVTGSKKESVP